MKKIAVTGGAGQIAYSLLFKIANGELFGKDEPIALHILELEHSMNALEGVVMELLDCVFPNLHDIKIGHDPHEVFEGISFAFLVGAKPRSKGMERKDLLSENGKIFIEQGKALEKADKDVRILVVGNPCNTNCLIASHYAKELPSSRFYAMTKLDENRGKAQLALKAKAQVSSVKNLCVWGNHSATQVPDYTQATIGAKKAEDVITDVNWLQKDFFECVQKRGAKVIEARGKSSAASAAQAAYDSAKDLLTPTKPGDFYSVSSLSDNNPYGISNGIFFSFPTRTDEKGDTHIVEGLELTPFVKEKIALTEKELLEEKSCVQSLLS